MRAIKSAVLVIGGLIPVLYCGTLVYHFVGVGGSAKGVADIGLGPTVLGLGIIGLIFVVVLLFKVMRVLRDPGGPTSRRKYDDDADDGTAIDADAAIARYLAEKRAEPAPAPARPAPSPGFGGPAKPRGFGRRTS